MRFISILITSLILSVVGTSTGFSQEADLDANERKAVKIFERLAGRKTSADNPAIKQMAALLKKGNALGAAEIATKDPGFYNITVKGMALEMSTQTESIKTGFNDFAASFMGSTRDQKDARELLNGNFYYAPINPEFNYSTLERNNMDLINEIKRVEPQVISLNSTESAPHPDPAGVLTSSAFMRAHAILGTNRRLVEYAFREFMCVGLSEWSDVGASDAYVGQDIDRFPAGDHNLYQTNCKGCHSMLDGFRGAFAKFDLSKGGPGHSQITAKSGRYPSLFSMPYDSNGIVSKYARNEYVFPMGYKTVDDTFVNNATRPANAALFGWRGNFQKGKGAREFGTIIANSRRFSQCMAKRVFKKVCRSELDEAKNKALLVKWGDEFEASGYKLKKLFETMVLRPECHLE